MCQTTILYLLELQSGRVSARLLQAEISSLLLVLLSLSKVVINEGRKATR